MKHPKLSRRDMLKGTGVVLAGAAFSTRVVAAAPPPEPITPALIEAAK
jgi:iron(III) transport system substrate-binding protein